jgi:hypothetical protein
LPRAASIPCSNTSIAAEEVMSPNLGHFRSAVTWLSYSTAVLSSPCVFTCSCWQIPTGRSTPSRRRLDRRLPFALAVFARLPTRTHAWSNRPPAGPRVGQDMRKRADMRRDGIDEICCARGDLVDGATRQDTPTTLLSRPRW